MRYSIHGKTLEAKKARILINALVDCAKAGIKSSLFINKMLWGISLYLECGRFHRENWRTYQRASDAAEKVRESDDKNWKGNFTFQRPAPDQLILDGQMDNHKIHMQMHLVDRDKFLLVNRGFHWIQEYPFNR